MKTKTNLLLILSFFALIMSCDDDETARVDSTPEFISFVEAISSLPGETLFFEGVGTDPAGVQSINIKYEPWFLDKTIIKDSLPDVYELKYGFKIPDDAQELSVHNIPITITNAGNVAVTKNVVVTLDKDITSPVITINSPTNGATTLISDGNEIELNIDLLDRELSEFKIESEILNETIAISGESYNYTNALDVTSPGIYTFDITVTDVTGNQSLATVSVNISTNLQFTAMFLTDETTDAALNQDLFGIPFNTTASQAAGENGFVFTARYYSSAPNSEVRFIPQQASFEPFTFGVSSSDPSKLALGQNATVDPIIIPGVGYYEITMDVRDLSYTVTPYSPTDAVIDQVYIIGTGIFVDGESTCSVNADASLRCFHFSSSKPFTKDVINDYVWTANITVMDEPSDATTNRNGFILNSNSQTWAPFWRTDPNDRSVAIPGGGTNYFFDESDLDKDYTFIFDTHLNRLIVKDR